jgi:hypothetical protein
METMETRHLRSLSFAASFLTLGLVACGDDGGGIDAGPDEIIDAAPRADVMNGVVCSGAEANYTGTLVTTGAQNNGTEILFRGDLNADTPPDRLQMRIANNATTPTGTFTLPASEWVVSLCLDDPDGSCANALSGYSGTLRVDSVESRLQASLDRIIFVDNLTTPTCSASLTQSSLDVAIDAPP